MKPSNIGGQAVMEGIMMRHKDKYAVAVRRPDKEIELKVEDYKCTFGKAAFCSKECEAYRGRAFCQETERSEAVPVASVHNRCLFHRDICCSIYAAAVCTGKSSS